MKKLSLVILTFVVCTQVSAQQLPLFSQYYFNSFIYNPSQTGFDEGTSLNLIARKQFTGLANSIGTYATTFQTRQKNKNSGFGLHLYNDNVHLFRTNAISGSYAYHIPLSGDKTLSFGLALSALDHKYNASNFYLINEGDPIVALLGSEGGFTVDANAGVNIDFGKFSMGLANLQLFQSQEAFKDNADNKSLYTLANHWMFNIGYKKNINDNLILEPYLLYRKTKGAPGQMDLNIFLKWMNKGYAGIAYRDGMSFSTMFGVNITPAITASYAFDITTNKLRTALGNTHEISLQFDLGKRDKKARGDVLASSEKEEYEKKINNLTATVTSLKENNTTKTDTIVVEKIVVKEVIKEVPVIKEVVVVKEVPVETKKPIETVVVTTPNKPVVKEVPVPTKTKPVITSVLDFYVIAGSFASSTAATKYISRLRSQGQSSYQKYDANVGRYYVHVGKFNDKNEAIALIQKLKGSGLALWIKNI